MLGDLAQISLPKVMRLLDLHRETGLLSIWSDAGIYRVALQNGYVAAAISPNPAENLFLILQRIGMTPLQSHPSVLQHTQTEPVPYGTYLLEHYHLSASQLEKAFCFQMEQFFFPLFFLRAGQFRFSSSAPLPFEDMTGHDERALSITLEAVRYVNATPATFDALPQSDCLLKRVDLESSFLKLSEMERRILNHLKTPKPLLHLSRYLLADLVTVRQTVKSLIDIELVQIISEADGVTTMPQFPSQNIVAYSRT